MSEVLIQTLKVIEVAVGIALIFIILVQNKNVTLNLSSMGGGMWVVTKRGADKVLHNTTIILGTVFIITSILLFVAH